MNQILAILRRAKVLFTIKTIRGGLDIVRAGDISFFKHRLYEILFQTPPSAAKIFSESRGIDILTTKHTLYVAYLIQEHLDRAGINSRVLERLDDSTPDAVLHIVICPTAFKKLPRYMIAFQMEQTTALRWFNNRYLHILRARSIAIIDYSLSNIGVLSGKYRIPFQKIYYFPIGHSDTFRDQFFVENRALDADREYEYDLAFYGAMNDRRRNILDRLGQCFTILVISECFGVELYRQLARAGIVINLHFYEPALLETTRIHECLALGYRVISEVAINQTEYQQRLDGLVDFVDFSDLESAIQRIRHILDVPEASPDNQSGKAKALAETTAWSRFYFLRMLAGLQIIDHPLFEAAETGAPMPSKLEVVCLSLPETSQRRLGAWVPVDRHVEFFDGVRHPLGWVGCALSYKALATHALAKGVKQMLVYEDDVDPVKLDGQTLASIELYLRGIEGEWDVFCGLITNLAESAVISACHNVGDLTFVHLDKMTGTVFNIYSHNALRILADWTYVDPDTTLTIDRYLEAKANLRVVTVFPFVAGHKDELISTLWGFRNSSYRDWIATSQRQLGDKIEAFLLH